MNIVVEGGRLSVAHFTGIGNVMAQALLAWADARPDDRFIVLTYAPLNAEFAEKAARRSNIFVQINPVPSFVPSGARNAFWFYFLLPWIVRGLDAALYWAASSLVPFLLPASLRVLTTVYDLVPVLYPETMQRKGKIISAISYRYSIRRANVLWTISNHIRKELQRLVPEARGKPIVVACAVDHELFKPRNFTPEQQREVLQRLIPGFRNGRTLLFVGTTEPRKNLGFLISLMPTLAPNGINLIVVGGRGWGKALPADAVAIATDPANRTFFAGRISNNDLVDIYSAADLFVSASLDEGFCMPAVEAMACETPVLLADNSAMSEVIGCGGKKMKGWDPQSWIHEISIEKIHPYNVNPIAQAKIYSWPKQIVKVLDIVESK